MVREQTAATLDKFIIMDDATLTDETSETGTLAIEGPETPAIVRELAGVDLLALPIRGHVMATVKVAGVVIPCRVIHRSLFGFPGAEFLVGRDALIALWPALAAAVHAHGGAPIGYRALNALRLEAGIAWFGTDFEQRQIPHEAALEATHISFTKGCYTGQEIVERVRSRGHVNRRLAGMQFGGAEPPEADTKLLARGIEGRGAEVGNVTSAAFSPLLGRPIGLGYVRREQSALGTILQSSETTAEIIELPLPGALPATLPPVSLSATPPDLA